MKRRLAFLLALSLTFASLPVTGAGAAETAAATETEVVTEIAQEEASDEGVSVETEAVDLTEEDKNEAAAGEQKQEETVSEENAAAAETTDEIAAEVEPEVITEGKDAKQEASVKNGWVNEGSSRYYYNQGKAVTNWQKIDGAWYYFNGSGAMQTGWQWLSNKWYYFDENDGTMQLGFKELGDRTYYFTGSGDGTMQLGLKELGGRTYYFTGSGAMGTGWQKIDNVWYYFNGSGVMQTGWQKVGDRWFYMSDDEADKGKMVTGWKTINGRKYYFDPSGAMATGWRKVDGYWYLMSPGGAMLTGWQKIGNYWYFLDADGAMATGWRTIGDQTYFLADGGVLADCGGEGTMLRGFHLIDGKACYFGMGGALQEDWASKNVIVIDPGHSSEIPDWKVPVGPGSDDMKDADNYGAVSVTNGLHEYELVLDVSLKLKEKLEARGYKVVMVRTTNNGKYSCVDRAKVANSSNAALFLRVHANAAPKTPSQNGAMTICITRNNEFVPEMYKRSRQLSDLILREYINAVDCYNEGVWERDDMIANNWSKVPTTLIELGYMTNAREDQLMQTPVYQEKMVSGLLNGIDSYFRAVNN